MTSPRPSPKGEGVIMKAGGTTRRPLVLQMDRGVFFFLEPAYTLNRRVPGAHGGATMLDLNLIREHPDLLRTALKNRQMDDTSVEDILRLDEKRRQLLTEVEKLKAERNAVSKEIGKMKDAAEREKKINAMRDVGDRISALDKEVADLEAELTSLVAS